jgi:hypothetical protein
MLCWREARGQHGTSLVFVLDASTFREALSEKLEKEWKKNNITISEFRHFPKPGKGPLLGQKQEAKGKTFELFCLLCVDKKWSLQFHQPK